MATTDAASDAEPKVRVVWIKTEGVNTTMQAPLPALLNSCANSLQQDFHGPKILEGKDASPPKLRKYITSAGLEPFGTCPLARHLGLPLTLYAKPPAEAGQPSKDKPNLVALHLSLGIRDARPPPPGMVRGRALLVLEDPDSGALHSVEPELVVKLLFFLGDLLSDTLGRATGAELERKLEDAKFFWQFYGPGVHVKNCEVLEKRLGPNPGQVQTYTKEDLLAVKKRQDAASHLRLNPGQPVPAFLMEPFLQDPAYWQQLEAIVERGWRPPTDPAGEEGDEAGADDELPSFEQFAQSR